MPTPSNNILDLLTAYALGALEPEEVGHVSELLEKDSALRELLAELRATADQVAYGLPDAEPPAELRQKALDRAFGRLPQPHVPAAIRPMAKWMRGWLVGLGAAAAIALFAAVVGWAQLASVRNELAQTQARLAQQLAANAQVAKVLASNPQSIALTGAVGQGTILRDATNQFVLAATLPQLDTGKVYQLWLIESDTPVGVGTFTVDQQGNGLLALQQAQLLAGGTYAITAEPGPQGSERPSGPPVLISNPLT